MNKQTCYRHAQGFLDTGKMLLGISSQNGLLFLKNYFSPCVMNLSFSCELSLKLMYFLETGKEKKHEHRLKELYNLLSPEVRERIKNKYISKEGICTFENCMESNNNNFADYRYLHEEGKNGVGSHPWDLRKLAESMIEVAGEMLQEAEENAH